MDQQWTQQEHDLDALEWFRLEAVAAAGPSSTSRLLMLSGSEPITALQVNDTVVLDIASGKITDFIRFDLGQVSMVVGGKNRGRCGTLISREKHKGSFDIGIVRDAAGNEFATRCA